MNFYRLNPRIVGGEKIIRSGKKDLIGTAGALSAVGMNSNRGPMKFSKIFTAQASGHFLDEDEFISQGRARLSEAAGIRVFPQSYQLKGAS